MKTKGNKNNKDGVSRPKPWSLGTVGGGIRGRRKDIWS